MSTLLLQTAGFVTSLGSMQARFPDIVRSSNGHHAVSRRGQNESAAPRKQLGCSSSQHQQNILKVDLVKPCTQPIVILCYIFTTDDLSCHLTNQRHQMPQSAIPLWLRFRCMKSTFAISRTCSNVHLSHLLNITPA